MIRPATPSDVPTIRRFILELAEYEKARHEAVATDEDLRRTLFGDAATTHCVICEGEDGPIGFAVYFFNYSTWQGRRGLYLEDLYVTPSARGRGAGKGLLRHLARIAVDNDCGRFEWSVLDWNRPAIEFYEAMGATPQSEWIKYRLDGEALMRLAQG